MARHNANCQAADKSCLCNTCKYDHMTCCSVDHDDLTCPILSCEDYEKEGE